MINVCDEVLNPEEESNLDHSWGVGVTDYPSGVFCGYVGGVSMFLLVVQMC